MMSKTRYFLFLVSTITVVLLTGACNKPYSPKPVTPRVTTTATDPLSQFSNRAMARLEGDGEGNYTVTFGFEGDKLTANDVGFLIGVIRKDSAELEVSPLWMPVLVRATRHPVSAKRTALPSWTLPRIPV